MGVPGAGALEGPLPPGSGKHFHMAVLRADSLLLQPPGPGCWLGRASLGSETYVKLGSVPRCWVLGRTGWDRFGKGAMPWEF